MKDFSVYYEIFKHLFMKLLLLFQNWGGRLLLFFTLVLPTFTTLQVLLILFFIAYTVDFLTGVLASYIEVKNGTEDKPDTGFILQSKKMRSSVVKLIGYSLVILLIYTVDSIFFNKGFDFSYLKTKTLTLTEITVCACIAIEAYSAVFENLKRAGFDILGKITTIADSGWKLFRKVKGEGNE